MFTFSLWSMNTECFIIVDKWRLAIFRMFFVFNMTFHLDHVSLNGLRKSRKFGSEMDIWATRCDTRLWNIYVSECVRTYLYFTKQSSWCTNNWRWRFIVEALCACTSFGVINLCAHSLITYGTHKCDIHFMMVRSCALPCIHL